MLSISLKTVKVHTEIKFELSSTVTWINSYIDNLSGSIYLRLSLDYLSTLPLPHMRVKVSS